MSECIVDKSKHGIQNNTDDSHTMPCTRSFYSSVGSVSNTSQTDNNKGSHEDMDTQDTDNNESDHKNMDTQATGNDSDEAIGTSSQSESQPQNKNEHHMVIRAKSGIFKLKLYATTLNDRKPANYNEDV